MSIFRLGGEIKFRRVYVLVLKYMDTSVYLIVIYVKDIEYFGLEALDLQGIQVGGGVVVEGQEICFFEVGKLDMNGLGFRNYNLLRIVV